MEISLSKVADAMQSANILSFMPVGLHDGQVLEAGLLSEEPNIIRDAFTNNGKSYDLVTLPLLISGKSYDVPISPDCQLPARASVAVINVFQNKRGQLRINIIAFS